MRKQDLKRKAGKNKKIIVWKLVLGLAISLTLLFSTFSAWAALVSVENTKMGNYVIRQEKHKSGSILTVKPAAVDLRILNIINNEGMSSLEDYERWLKENISYQKDNAGDQWSSAEETLARKSGDCEDFAFLNAAFLHVLGYQPKVMAMYGVFAGGGHAICVFEGNGQYFWFDNTSLNESSATSMEELNKIIYQKYACFAFYEINFDDREQNTVSEDIR